MVFFVQVVNHVTLASVVMKPNKLLTKIPGPSFFGRLVKQDTQLLGVDHARYIRYLKPAM